MLSLPIQPMLLQKSDSPPVGSEWIHQMKWDGFRCLLVVKDGQMRLFSRHGNDCTAQFVEMQNIKINARNAVVDGEMVVLKDGMPDFESVMQRFRTSKSTSINQLAKSLPAHYVAFDILYVDNVNMTRLPLENRIDTLEDVVIPSNQISLCQSFEDGLGLFEATKRLGLEGIVSKKRSSKYVFKRSADWLKTKAYLYETVSIAGIRKGEFGWLIEKEGQRLGVMEFVPPVPRKAFYLLSRDLVIEETEKWIFVKPLIQAKVKFQCYTNSGKLRSPSFVQFLSESG